MKCLFLGVPDQNFSCAVRVFLAVNNNILTLLMHLDEALELVLMNFSTAIIS